MSNQTGHQKINWAAQHSPVLNAIKKKYFSDGTFKGVNIGVTIPLEAKTAYLCIILKESGANVAVAATAPGYLQEDVAAALADYGVAVYASGDASAEEFERNLERVVATEPSLLIDDRAELTRILITKRQDLIPKVWGGGEQTTSGITKIKNMEREGVLKYPMIASNDAECKHLFDNRYGTGQSVWAAILANTNLFVGGKNVVVAGYGWCGKGLARRADGLNARVIVCEVNPVRALEAVADGFTVMSLTQAAEAGDFFITSTGCKHVFRGEHFERMKDGAVLANAGGVDIEIDVEGLQKIAAGSKEVRRNITQYTLSNGRRINVLCRGLLVNLAGGDGHPVEIMDLTFAVQALAVYYLAKNRGKLENKLYPLPREIDFDIARTKLESMGIFIDSLTGEQQEFLRSWT
jgi:adenosylhomocysteinase